MQIFVRNLAGEVSAQELSAQATVADIQTGVAGESHLSFAGKALDASALVSAVLTKDAVVDVNIDLDGAGKKRKKKQYTKPKRIPHKHKKVKLAVLKF